MVVAIIEKSSLLDRSRIVLCPLPIRCSKSLVLVAVGSLDLEMGVSLDFERAWGEEKPSWFPRVDLLGVYCLAESSSALHLQACLLN